MEYGASRPAKVSGIFNHFAKVFKFASRGVDVNHEPQNDGSDIEDHDMSKLFDTISSLKSAYIQYQGAHIPYDPKKMKAADNLLVAHLKFLSDIERFYLEKHKSIPGSSLASLNVEIARKEELFEKLRHQAQAKDIEVLRLGWEIEELVQKNLELEEEIKRTLSAEKVILLSYADLNPDLFAPAVSAAHKSIHEFARPFIGLMKASGWNLDQAADSVAGSVTYLERSHKKYAFEAYISRKMFCSKGFSRLNLKSRDIGRVMRFKDPFDALIENPDSDFARFCISKYVLVVHLDMELAFFGNSDQMNFVRQGSHPRTPFYRAFVNMARWVWFLLVMTATVAPEARMFYVEKGRKYVDRHMDSVVNVEGSSELLVGFTVTPGFWIRNAERPELIRCRVYLS